MISNRELFLRNTAQTSTSPRLLEIERAEGLYLYGPDGKAYMDLVSGFAVSNIGHRHPEVLKAIAAQAERFLHLTVYGEFIQSPQVKFAERLASVLPSPLSSVYFVNSGAEATEGAMKLAKRFTGRTEIIACRNSYHGSTQGALSLMGNEYYKEAYRPLLPGIRFIQFNDLADLDQISHQTAAVFVETIQGEAGVIVPDIKYMQALRERCSECGVLLVLDEIQTAFGRTGALFAFSHFGIVPDILLTAKGMGGGLPIGAFISSPEMMASLSENPILGHITTFGGHPLSCAAGLASLNAILDQQLYEGADAKEQLFRSLLRHPKVKEVRGMGLMLSMQLSAFEEVEALCQFALERGLLIDWFLHCSTAVRIAPPLTIEEAEIKKACAIILEGLDRLPA